VSHTNPMDFSCDVYSFLNKGYMVVRHQTYSSRTPFIVRNTRC